MLVGRLPVIRVGILLREGELTYVSPIAASLVDHAHVIEVTELLAAAVGGLRDRKLSAPVHLHHFEIGLDSKELALLLGARPGNRVAEEERLGLDLRAVPEDLDTHHRSDRSELLQRLLTR